MAEPNHVQITALAGGEWGWVVWYGGDAHPLDREGTEPSLDAALERVREAVLGGMEAAG